MEKIILQSLEDLWMPGERDECIEFFRGERFGICADIAGISLYEQAKLLNLANRIIDSFEAERSRQKVNAHKNRVTTFKALIPWNARIAEIAAAHNHSQVFAR
ncbi:MAG: hypothetical protein OEW04_05215 [Nitrospirota bacterium]|nr:hypothetical protein [Nitrospirota bacterium]